jgi:hypothetical protein
VNIRLFRTVRLRRAGCATTSRVSRAITVISRSVEWAFGAASRAPVTLKQLLISAVLETPAQQHPLSVEDKIKCYGIYKRLHSATEDTIKLSVEEVALLKAAAGAIYVPLVLGQLFEMLEGEFT